MTVPVDDDSDITHIPILCSRICYVSIFVSVFLPFFLSQPFSCHVSLKIAYGTRLRRKNNRPMFHPLNHLSITVEKGKGVSTHAYRHVGPPSSLAEYAQRIIMRAQLRDGTYTFFKTTAIHLQHASLSVFLAYIHSDASVSVIPGTGSAAIGHTRHRLWPLSISLRSDVFVTVVRLFRIPNHFAIAKTNKN